MKIFSSEQIMKLLMIMETNTYLGNHSLSKGHVSTFQLLSKLYLRKEVTFSLVTQKVYIFKTGIQEMSDLFKDHSLIALRPTSSSGRSI